MNKKMIFGVLLAAVNCYGADQNQSHKRVPHLSGFGVCMQQVVGVVPVAIGSIIARKVAENLSEDPVTRYAQAAFAGGAVVTGLLARREAMNAFENWVLQK